MQIQVREFLQPDADFIYSSWLNSYKNDSSFARKIARSVFFKWHKKIVELILNRPTTKVMIACFEETPEVILGYLVYERQTDLPVVHFAYVKKDYRQQGIANTLLKSQNLDLNQCLFSHWTDSIYDFKFKEKYPKMMYDPYRI